MLSGSGSAKNIGQYVGAKPQISAEREPLSNLLQQTKR